MNLLKKLNLGFQFLGNMGPRYVGYRVKHELEKRTGSLLAKHPVKPPVQSWISLADWQGSSPAFFFESRNGLGHSKKQSGNLEQNAHNILSGKIQFFSDEWMDLGKSYDWVTNPTTGYRYDVTKHWSQIQDLNPEQGDIKYVWEKSRFTYLLTILRYDHHFDQDNSAFVFSQIEDWIDHNPINQGPNWRCSQEISLRLINWMYALYFYKDSPELTAERWGKIQQIIYWSLQHVYQHIDFSRIAVRNNHAITETLMLTVSELLFPFIPETKLWSQKGREWFETEINYQIYEDGTFLQFSMNYHRVVVQLLSFGLGITEIHQKPFSKEVYEKALASVNFLFQCQNEGNGWLPNYGANDGALFFPLSEQHYRDYRPQLSCLYRMITKGKLYSQGDLEEENWIKNTRTECLYSFPKIEKKQGLIAFEIGGYYLIRDGGTLTFLRCGNHRDRPQQADNLHLDIWEKTDNILKDAGSYKYNANLEILRYFVGTLGHNTVTLNRHDQMLKGSRFIWFYWTQRKMVKFYETEKNYVFEGEITAYAYLKKGIVHRRKVTKEKGQPAWEIEDEVRFAPPESVMFQHWHGLSNEVHEIAAKEKTGKSAEMLNEVSYYSSSYGKYEKQKMITFSSNTHFLKTILQIK
ncbi:alginate lyase family protein [Rhodonellum sp.]|uniref:alginate lyase family protein n=1 Tax=Rhodonellum sp. TaxID=2231180 RepID=UPI00271DD5C5|nr:alginate lyase family protein [Rhodonellum sp.]MDO9551473.1 alginate lyase family protein [Rhodonellum sp.]